MAIESRKYIPAGCLSIPRDYSHLSDQDWSSHQLRAWKSFAPYLDGVPQTPHTMGGDDKQYLSPEIQAILLKAPGIKPYAALFRERWVQFEFMLSSVNPEQAVLRVYLLPDDIDRAILDRSDSNLKRARQALLQTIDYSPDAWVGCRSEFTPANYPLQDPLQASQEENMSLLELFNTIPSPSPDPELVQDSYRYDAMVDLLGDRTPGLQTTLYPHQKRSAAQMLQKEAQPGKFLDPRLLHVLDQQGLPWYLDPVAGTVLDRPIEYEDVSGGILAEEMGAGKTLICLSLILASKSLPTQFPDDAVRDSPKRAGVASLIDMAASCATRNNVPWRPYFDVYRTETGYELDNCMKALERNPACYYVPAPEPRRRSRHHGVAIPPPRKIYMSNASIIIAPNNLISHWKDQIHIHTIGLKVFVLTKNDRRGKKVRKPAETEMEENSVLPGLDELRNLDILLFSQSRLESLVKEYGGIDQSPLAQLHFKRCIVDEGHRLGNSKAGNKSNLLLGLDSIRVSSRWIVTGTPSRGLFGLDSDKPDKAELTAVSNNDDGPLEPTEPNVHETSVSMEKQDLERIGSMTALFLKARPWANTSMDPSDTPADWTTYLMLPRHNPRSRGRWSCLKSTLSSLIVRHQRKEVVELLPPIDEKVVILDGSYQDQLSSNIFSMMIIFNSVQSQRTDMDYFFHPKQRKSLLQIVHNLKQTSFFGGSFFTAEEIATSVKTAETFLEEGKVPISSEDEALLRSAIQFGHLAMSNKLRKLGNQYHEMPVTVTGFPGGAGQSWSLDGESGDVVCTSATMLLALQRLIYKSEEAALNSLLNGGLVQEGLKEKENILAAVNPEKTTKSQTLAGNTKLGDDTPQKNRSHGANGIDPKKLNPDSLAGPLELTHITSTVSAKLSYLVDGIIKYQEKEKIIIFYDNDNVAWYLAGMLDVLQVHHLIYAKGITSERRSQYVTTFHHNDTFRVLLMDISQAAFGLDMRGASRVYFINPVLNPQVEAQAIGRVRRISQQKPVSVETLVLRNSIDEVILERKRHMTQAEHRQVKSILDIRSIYNWIKNATINELPGAHDETPLSQMTPLKEPQRVFGRGFGQHVHPDDGLVLEAAPIRGNGQASALRATGPSSSSTPSSGLNGAKRIFSEGPGSGDTLIKSTMEESNGHGEERLARRVRFG
ncbi:P-loop containing nucleoside triphosphate hydrolase protein [Stachybotrys elegans]|uniref:P-loop containing nucleoside triphosphate hydrolase protein n=1 Tax=Stachybotrys elegans TaxID=80388 RepID=A0A8K0T2N2_9HYPO|nr:P-loop containing nucleoside triphosphate hydrolase protein [Stachybotrys elegans]